MSLVYAVDGPYYLALGADNDIYIIDGDDTIFEMPDEGIDRVGTYASFWLPAHFEDAYLLGTGHFALTGNNLANKLLGNSGNNLINGLGGADYMWGQQGNDVYIVDDAGDLVAEAPNQGTDTVRSTVAFELSVHVENLFLLGTAAINGTGNERPNVIVGNSADNTIYGLGGNDTIGGGFGNDVLWGGTRLMAGSAKGRDVFVFDTPLDAARNVDKLVGFFAIQDAIRLDNAVMSNLGSVTGQLSAEKFWKSAAGVAHDADDRIIYKVGTGELFYDRDGIGAAGAIPFATIVGNLAANASLNHLDFFVI